MSATEKPAHSLPDDVRFLLGEMSAVIRALPSRMDRFEATTDARLQSIEGKIDSNVKPIEARVGKLEQAAASHKTILMAASGLIAAGVSGFITKFFH
jgi:hypothetical protein